MNVWNPVCQISLFQGWWDSVLWIFVMIAYDSFVKVVLIVFNRLIDPCDRKSIFKGITALARLLSFNTVKTLRQKTSPKICSLHLKRNLPKCAFQLWHTCSCFTGHWPWCWRKETPPIAMAQRALIRTANVLAAKIHAARVRPPTPNAQEAWATRIAVGRSLHAISVDGALRTINGHVLNRKVCLSNRNTITNRKVWGFVLVVECWVG